MDELEEYFLKLRFDNRFHLGLGDVRLTITMQKEVIDIAKKAHQIRVDNNEVNPLLEGVCENCLGDPEIEKCATCGKPRTQGDDMAIIHSRGNLQFR